MPKELPYFEFEPAEYLSGNVSFCSLEAQGFFILMCCYYWQRECSLTENQLLKRIDRPELLKELIIEDVISVNDVGFLKIKFLDEKLNKALKISEKNKINGAKGGRPKNPNETQIKPKLNPNESQTKGIREDNIIEDNIIKEKIIVKEDLYRSFAHLKISKVEFDKLLQEGFSKKEIDSILDSVENYSKNKNYKNLYLTAKKWLEKDRNGKSEQNRKGATTSSDIQDYIRKISGN